MTGIKRALVSVYDKTDIADFCRGLSELGVELIASGGTAKLLVDVGIPVTSVSDYTGFPEVLDGRVKTMHPVTVAGVLADRDNKEHMKQLEEQNIGTIDMVIYNLYPFEETVKSGADLKDVIENIDIGGPTMIRSAAKNHKDVVVVTDPADYSRVLEELKQGQVSEETRKALALKAFSLTAQYDSIISSYFQDEYDGEKFPENLSFAFRKIQELRYGENPHQEAAFYSDIFHRETSVANAKKLHGKALSYNNIMDADSAFELVKDFEEPTAAVIKHNNPCGVASRNSIEEAYKEAHAADPMSAFGSIVALSRPCNLAIAKQMGELFIEIIICPSFEEDALALLKEKKNIRLLETGPITKSGKGYNLKKVVGGMLAQSRDFPVLKKEDLNVVSKRTPTDKEFEDLLFAWKVVKHVKSNAILFAKDKATVGIGAGQMSRIDSCKIAAMKAGENSKGAVMASDAFFPFRDGIDEAKKAGITAIIQPGGSKRDEKVIKAADEHDMAMVFTGARAFKH